MKKTIFILSLALIFVTIGLFHYFRKFNQEKDERNTLQTQYDVALKANKGVPLAPIDSIKDSTSATYIYNTIRTTGPINGYVSKGLADTLATALKIQSKEIESLKSMVVTASAKGKGERFKDTIRNTEWLVMAKDPVFDVKVDLKTDSIFPSAKIRLSQAHAPYRKSVFHRYQYKTAIMTNDPRVSITDVFDVTKVPQSSRWGLGLTLGPVVTPKGFSWGASLGLSYDVIQF